MFFFKKKMPTFSEFKSLGIFPQPATAVEVPYWGSTEDPLQRFVDDSSINTPNASCNFWWLIYKFSFTVDWTVTFNPINEFSEEETYNGSFTVEFINDVPPNDRICSEDLLFEGTGSIVEWSGDADMDLAVDKFYNIEPFQCEKVHSLFWVERQELVFSTGMSWYVTGSERLDRSQEGDFTLLDPQEIPIELPSGEEIILYAYTDFLNAGYGDDATAESTITIDPETQIEWYEPE